ncbi:MAG: energy-coupled thiamine transporter ThiT [Selenomonas sp.]|jgi:thiamine transporter|nr:energy-coupled thiamine transporter ThiT [Selenomonas sp.]MDD6119317.1 energy-coupled thiamine transporter ThiT [Selenomonadaceae bacterium]
MEKLLTSPTSVLALLGVLALILGMLRVRRIEFSIHLIVNIALMLGLAIILHQIRLYHMPQGGSITLGGMVPLLLLAYRYGPGIGALGGFLFGLINMIQDPYILHPVQVLFDYPLPYMAMGLAGLFPQRILPGTALAFFTRLICHVISGVVFFASFAPAGQSPLVYSLIFNGTYLVPEFIICAVILRLLPLERLLVAMDPQSPRRT